MSGAVIAANAVPIAIGAGTAAAGAGVSAYANNQQLRKQDATAAQGIIKQNALRGQAGAVVDKTIQERATNNAANLEANKNTLNQQYAAALQRANPVQSGAVSSTPGAGKRYAADVLASRGDIGKYGTDLASRTAAIDAPVLTNQQTQLAMGDTATKLGLIHDTSANQGALTDLQVKAIQANPWLLAGGAALQGAGEAYAGSGTLNGKAKVAGKPAGAGLGTLNPLGGPAADAAMWA